MNTNELKQEIFPKYVGKCKVSYVNPLYPEDKPIIRDFLGLNIFYGGATLFTNKRPVELSDCQLVLKRISGIDFKDMRTITDLALSLHNHNYPDNHYRFDNNGTTIGMRINNDWFDETVRIGKSSANVWIVSSQRVYNYEKIILFLFSRRYALSDKWFDNGIAVEAEND